MIWMVVEAGVIGFATSVHRTTIPFKPMLTESIDNVEMRDEAPGTELITKVNVDEFIVLCLI